MAATDSLSVVFAALADPTRRSILSRLREGPTTAGDLAAPFAMSKPAISQHLKVLETAGLVERAATAQWRTISLREAQLDEVAQWIDLHRVTWNERFDALDEHVELVKSRDMKGREK
jgi:DNA-binding transcriptional ArsR family regulator